MNALADRCLPVSSAVERPSVAGAWVAAALAGLAIVFLTAAEPAVDEQAKQDRQLMQGAWEYDYGEQDGKRDARLGRPWAKVVIEGDTLTRHVIPSENSSQLKHTFKLDTSFNPRLIDFTRSEGGRKGQLSEGIYSIDKDTLKLCFYRTPDVKKRPTDFTAAEGTGFRLIVLRRVKP
jgi:uncharacterized protein (TIGR03067 family)